MALGLAATCTNAMAQQYDYEAYDKSVFSNYRFLQAKDKGAMMATVEKVKYSFPGWNASVDKLNNNFLDIYGDAIAVQGNTLLEKTQNLITGKLKDLSVDKAEWILSRNEQAPHASYVDYDQYINGHNVVFSRLSFRFTTANKLVRIRMNNYGAPTAAAPAKDAASMLRTQALTSDLSGIKDPVITVANDWVWFPVPSANGYDVKPAWGFTVTGTSADNFPMELKGYIDGMTGELLYRTNDIKEAFNVKVKGSVYTSQNNITTPPVATDEPLANLTITIGSTSYNADDTGGINISALNAPQTPTFKLQGPWSVVHTGGSSGTIPSFSQAIATNGTTYIFPNTSPSTIQHVNAYYHVNIVHDFMKKYLPTFTNMDVALPTNVDLTSGSCNAFYNGNSINFYAASGACASFAKVGDIVYHEYGHGISGRFYSAHSSSSIDNGALNEGCSDVWAFSITRDSILGRNSYITGGNIRSYSGAKVYPQDIKGEVHADGEIIAGSWYYVAIYTGSFDTMTNIFTKTYFDVPDGPAGTEGQVYHDVLVSAILNDDDDGQLSNGTPHMAAIVRAFADHGIYLMSDAVINHTELNHQPAGQPINIAAQLTLTESAFFQDLKLFYKVRGNTQWDSVALTNTGNYNFTGQIPAQPGGAIVDYCFAVYDVLNNSTFGFPNGYNHLGTPSQMTIPYQFGVGLNQVLKVDFETPANDWTIANVTNDDATNGKWIQAVPIAASYQGLIMQTGADHTSGTGQCLVTGNGSNVDNGRTTAMSPVYDLTSFTYPVFEYYRWYSNDRGLNARSDVWNVQVRDSKSSFWKSVDYTYQSDYSWRRRVFAMQEYLPVSKTVQIKFVASDAVNTSLTNNGQNNIEAAVDDFAIYDIWPVSVDKTQQVKATIYPNPADNTLNITLPPSLKGKLALYDMTGKAVASAELDGSTTLYHINTSQLPAGNYMLMIEANKLIQSKKVTIAH